MANSGNTIYGVSVLIPLPNKVGEGYTGFTLSVCLQATWFPEHKLSLLWNFNLKFHVHVDCCRRQKPFDFQWCHFQNGRLVAILDFFWFPDSNFSLALNINSRLSSSLFVSVSRSLLIVSYIYIYILWSPVAHCCPCPAGGCILVDHWSTILVHCGLVMFVWHLMPRSALVQIIACTVPSHYLKRYWLIHNKIL